MTSISSNHPDQFVYQSPPLSGGQGEHLWCGIQ